MTATTCQHLVFKKTRVDQNLKDSGALGDYLITRWEQYKRWWTEKDPEKTQWTMWDIALISALAHPEWASIQTVASPSTQVERLIKVYTKIEPQEMEQDFWKHLHTLQTL